MVLELAVLNVIPGEPACSNRRQSVSPMVSPIRA